MIFDSTMLVPFDTIMPPTISFCKKHFKTVISCCAIKLNHTLQSASVLFIANLICLLAHVENNHTDQGCLLYWERVLWNIKQWGVVWSCGGPDGLWLRSWSCSVTRSETLPFCSDTPTPLHPNTPPVTHVPPRLGQVVGLPSLASLSLALST